MKCSWCILLRHDLESFHFLAHHVFPYQFGGTFFVGVFHGKRVAIDFICKGMSQCLISLCVLDFNIVFDLFVHIRHKCTLTFELCDIQRGQDVADTRSK